MQITGYATMMFPLERKRRKVKETVDPSSVIAVATKHFGFSVEELQSSCKKRDLSFVRQLCMETIRRRSDLQLNKIGRLFNRDHSTVVHA
jgi:chromosomal replication initiator protein